MISSNTLLTMLSWQTNATNGNLVQNFWSKITATWEELYAIDEFRLLVWAVIALIVFVVISYILLRRSRDRCVKDFEGYHVEAIMASGVEGDVTRYAYSGVLEVPIQAGNGFEVNYDLEAIENLPQLFSYLRTAEKYTGNTKYAATLKGIHERLQEVQRLDLEEDYVLNPFDPPPEASHKVYQQDLERLLAVVRFFEELPEVEMKARLAALEKFFHPGILRRTSRSLGNFLSFAWDRVKQIGNMITGYLTKGRAAEVQQLATEAQTATFSYTPRKFEALLENSIGYLVKAKVISPDGRIRFYRGVLKEYSDQFVSLYNVFYRLPRAAVYEDCIFKGLDPKVMFQVKGKPVKRDQDIEITCDESGKILKLVNVSGHYIFMGKIEADGQPLTGFKTLLGPDKAQTIALPARPKVMRLVYEEAFPSDIVLPRRLAVILGRAEPKMIKLESLRKFANKVKDMPASRVKDFQSKLFMPNGSDEIIVDAEEGAAQLRKAEPEQTR